jgi:hypothetical protein
MKKWIIEMSHGTAAQEQTFGLDLKITCHGYTKQGSRFMINGSKLQAPSLRIPGSGRKHGPRNGKPQAASHNMTTFI